MYDDICNRVLTAHGVGTVYEIWVDLDAWTYTVVSAGISRTVIKTIPGINPTSWTEAANLVIDRIADQLRGETAEDEARELERRADLLDSALLAPSMRSAALREEAEQLRRNAEIARKGQEGSGG